MTASDALGTYLEDHLGGAAAGVELAERLRDEHEGTELGTVMAGLAAEIAADRKVLEDLVERVEASKHRLKEAVGWVGEKATSLRTLPQVTGSAELTTLLRTETLSLGIEGKRCLWLAVGQLAGGDPRLAGIDFEGLAGRAAAQRAALEPHRIAAAAKAFSGG
jgi:hypothetical protein